MHEAYSWEVKNAGRTGLTADQLEVIQYSADINYYNLNDTNQARVDSGNFEAGYNKMDSPSERSMLEIMYKHPEMLGGTGKSIDEIIDSAIH
jgi:hypothetical protein